MSSRMWMGGGDAATTIIMYSRKYINDTICNFNDDGVVVLADSGCNKLNNIHIIIFIASIFIGIDKVI